jgi:hypothetical protein
LPEGTGASEFTPPINTGLGYLAASLTNKSSRMQILMTRMATVSPACRSGNISDDVWAIVPGISFRPTPQTVLRLN